MVDDAFGDYEPNNEPKKPSGKSNQYSGMSIRDRISDDITTGFDKTTNVVGSHVNDIMGSSVGGVIDDVKNLTTGAFDFIKGSMKTVFGFGQNSTEESQLEETERQTGLLQSILKVFKLQDKDDDRKFDKKEPSSLIVALLIGLVGLVAGYLSTALGPFKVFGKLFTPFKKGGMIYQWFSKDIPGYFKSLKMKMKSFKLPNFGKLKIFESISNLTKEGGMLSKTIKPFINVVKGVSKFISSKLTSLSNGFKSIAKMKIFKVSKIFGSVLFYGRAVYGVIKELFSEKNVRDKILGVSASILGLVAEIPEMIVNGLLKVFKSDFRVDFSKEAIEDVVNQWTKDINPLFTKVMDFFTIGISDFINNTMPAWMEMKKTDLSNWLQDINPFKGFEDGLLDITNDIPNWIEMKKTDLSNWLQDINPFNGFKDGLLDITDGISQWWDGKIKSLISSLPGFLVPEKYKTNGKGNDENNDGPVSSIPKNSSIIKSSTFSKDEDGQDDNKPKEKSFFSKLVAIINKDEDEVIKPSNIVNQTNKDQGNTEWEDRKPGLYTSTIEGNKHISKSINDQRSITNKQINRPAPEIDKSIKNFTLPHEPTQLEDTFVVTKPMPDRPIQSIPELTSKESDQISTATEVKNMSNRLDKTLREMKGNQIQNNQQQTQINQTMISSQNNAMSNKSTHIPEENRYTGIGILNGAMM